MGHIAVSSDGVIALQGEWNLACGADIQPQIQALEFPDLDQFNIDASLLTEFDTSGALLLVRLLDQLKTQGKHLSLENFQQKYANLLTLTTTQFDKLAIVPTIREKNGALHLIGLQAVKKFQQMLSYISFVGQLSTTFSQVITFRRKLHWQSTLNAIDDAGYQGLPIIALLMFLVGIVLSYQLGVQLQSYGANIFIVNLTGVAVLREFGPLIAAIIASGRTSSSYTAQIGLMKVNEELDALQVMGLSPMNRIALPKIIGVVIALPLVTLWADAFGVLGSMVMSQVKFGINMADFLQRFDDVTELSSLWTGLMKAPFFGLIIASVGCFKGFSVQYTTESIGAETTKSVVQAIFLVIVADAIFSILFSWAGI